MSALFLSVLFSRRVQIISAVLSVFFLLSPKRLPLLTQLQTGSSLRPELHLQLHLRSLQPYQRNHRCSCPRFRRCPSCCRPDLRCSDRRYSGFRYSDHRYPGFRRAPARPRCRSRFHPRNRRLMRSVRLLLLCQCPVCEDCLRGRQCRPEYCRRLFCVPAQIQPCRFIQKGFQYIFVCFQPQVLHR